MLRIYVDADACPVKPEVYRVAQRYGLGVAVVSNARMRVPDEPGIELVVVADGFDAADDWIVEHAGADDIVISADIPLASRCLAKGAHVLGPTGRPFTEDNIGDAVASRRAALRASRVGRHHRRAAAVSRARSLALPAEPGCDHSEDSREIAAVIDRIAARPRSSKSAVPTRNFSHRRSACYHAHIGLDSETDRSADQG